MTDQRGTSSVTSRCFVPLSVHLASHMYGGTQVLSLSVMLLLPAVYCNRFAMQRDVYATPSSGDGVGICSSFAFKAILQISSFLDTPQKCHFPAVIINDLLGNLG